MPSPGAELLCRRRRRRRSSCTQRAFPGAGRPFFCRPPAHARARSGARPPAFQPLQHLGLCRNQPPPSRARPSFLRPCSAVDAPSSCLVHLSGGARRARCRRRILAARTWRPAAWPPPRRQRKLRPRPPLAPPLKWKLPHPRQTLWPRVPRCGAPTPAPLDGPRPLPVGPHWLTRESPVLLCPSLLELAHRLRPWLRQVAAPSPTTLDPGRPCRRCGGRAPRGRRLALPAQGRAAAAPRFPQLRPSRPAAPPPWRAPLALLPPPPLLGPVPALPLRPAVYIRTARAAATGQARSPPSLPLPLPLLLARQSLETPSPAH
jgi:hypothetical protein